MNVQISIFLLFAHFFDLINSKFKTIIIGLLLAVSIISSGCASLIQISGMGDMSEEEAKKYPVPVLYGATMIDLAFLSCPFISGGGESGMIARIMCPVMFPLGLIDLPISLVTDTLLLPISLPRHIAHKESFYDDLTGIWGTGTDDIYVVGVKGCLRHFNGKKWEKIELETDKDITEICGISDNNIFIAGKGNTAYIYKDSWEPQTLHKHKAGFDYLDIVCSKDGKAAVLEEEILFLFDGVTWDERKIPYEKLGLGSIKFGGMWGTSIDNIYLAGETRAYKSRYDSKNVGIVLHFNGDDFKIIPTGNLQPIGIRGIWGTSDTDIFTFTWGGKILHFDGKNWTEMKLPEFNVQEVMSSSGHFIGRTNPSPLIFNKIWGTSPDNVYAVGHRGVLIHYNGIQWKDVNPGTEYTLNSVWGTSENNIYAVGSKGTILHYDGNNWKIIQ
jgi:uncharacterized protein YceK